MTTQIKNEGLNRSCSLELDQIIGRKFSVLDKGFIRLIDYMGSDQAIVQAARVSYGEGTKKLKEDTSLIRYLMRNKHTSPFEMCEIKLHIKLPIFIARQWIRHRTANVNEYSGRYSIIKDEAYSPKLDRLVEQSILNHQASDNHKKIDNQNLAKNEIDKINYSSYKTYIKLIDEYKLSRELARGVLSLNYYTEWYWKIDLHNLLHFLALRNDEHAQDEIKVYAEIIQEEIVKRWTPITYQAFLDYRLNNVCFSKTEIDAIKSLINNKKQPIKPESLGRSEWQKILKYIYE